MITVYTLISIQNYNLSVPMVLESVIYVIIVIIMMYLRDVVMHIIKVRLVFSKTLDENCTWEVRAMLIIPFYQRHHFSYNISTVILLLRNIYGTPTHMSVPWLKKCSNIYSLTNLNKLSTGAYNSLTFMKKKIYLALSFFQIYLIPQQMFTKNYPKICTTNNTFYVSLNLPQK